MFFSKSIVIIYLIKLHLSFRYVLNKYSSNKNIVAHLLAIFSNKFMVPCALIKYPITEPNTKGVLNQYLV